MSLISRIICSFLFFTLIITIIYGEELNNYYYVIVKKITCVNRTTEIKPCGGAKSLRINLNLVNLCIFQDIRHF
jgi:hypothetical protein